MRGLPPCGSRRHPRAVTSPGCRSCPTRRPGSCPTSNSSARVRWRPWLHPLVASATAPDHPRAVPSDDPVGSGQPHLVDCRGARHRIGLVDGVLVPLDHDADEIRREELLVALTGTPLPCLRAIDAAHRRPDCLTGVRERLDHGDTAGALAVVEGMLGPGALLRDGSLRDELEAAALRRITYGLFRADMTGHGPGSYRPDHRHTRSRPSRKRRSTVR